jgi:hypothetical protein
MVFTCGMTNPMDTRYPPETQWVWVRVQISTRRYEYGYEFLPVTPLLAARVIALPDPSPSLTISDLTISKFILWITNLRKQIEL